MLVSLSSILLKAFKYKRSPISEGSIGRNKKAAFSG
jgi:hypothetical protein